LESIDWKAAAAAKRSPSALVAVALDSAAIAALSEENIYNLPAIGCAPRWPSPISTRNGVLASDEAVRNTVESGHIAFFAARKRSPI